METKWIFKIDYSKSQSQARKFHSIFLIRSYMYKESPATRSYYYTFRTIKLTICKNMYTISEHFANHEHVTR